MSEPRGPMMRRNSAILLASHATGTQVQNPTPAAPTPQLLPDNPSKSLGVLYTGYLEKHNPYRGTYNRRFAVLTHEAIHWFIREDGYDLFGEERGKVALGAVLSIRVLDEQDAECATFELQTTEKVKRLFRAASKDLCNEWVSAIRSSVKNFATQQHALQHGGRGQGQGQGQSEEEVQREEVEVLLVSLRSGGARMAVGASGKMDGVTAPRKPSSAGADGAFAPRGGKTFYMGSETVLARLPDWGRHISIADVRDGDEVILSLSNGGTVAISSDLLARKAFNPRENEGGAAGADAKEFDLAVKDVRLPSSLRFQAYCDRCSVNGEYEDLDGGTGAGAGGGGAGQPSSAKEAMKNNQWRAVALTTDPRHAVNLLVSMMILSVGVGSMRFLTVHSSLLFVIAVVLASNNIVQAIIRFPSKADVIKTSYILVLRSHAYTSPDDPVINNPEEEIPQRFINGCDGDLKEAQRRWDITRHWRETEGVNGILQEPQPYFFIIKNYCPQYICGRGKEGHIVFYERPGDFDSVQLKARGVSLEQLTRHWLFVTEYQWNVIAPDPLAKSIAVLDIGTVTMNALAGESLEALKKTVAWANQHYPERSYVIFVINAPYWFSMIWKIVKPWVHENTQRKVKILSKKESLAGMLEHIDEDQIPDWYGGKLSYGDGPDSCRFKNPDVLAMNEFVKNLNEGKQPKLPGPTSATATAATSGARTVDAGVGAAATGSSASSAQATPALPPLPTGNSSGSGAASRSLTGSGIAAPQSAATPTASEAGTATPSIGQTPNTLVQRFRADQDTPTLTGDLFQTPPVHVGKNGRITPL